MRKYILILFFILFSFNTYAKENQDVSIKVLIEKIRRADVKDRRKLINQLKLKLRKVNKENQKKMAMKLKKSLNKNKRRNKNHLNRRHIRRYRHHRNHR
jgi:hypothetical protein